MKPWGKFTSREIAEMLAVKQLKANAGKSKFVILGTLKARRDILNSLEKDPVMMGENKIGVSKSEKYISHWINENGTSVVITETIDKRMNGPKKTIDDIIIIEKTDWPEQQQNYSNPRLCVTSLLRIMDRLDPRTHHNSTRQPALISKKSTCCPMARDPKRHDQNIWRNDANAPRGYPLIT